MAGESPQNSSSPPYEVIVSPLRMESLEGLPEEFKQALRAAFAAIADDPLGNSRVPPCPPFVPHGRLHECRVDYDNKRHTMRIFFEVDDERRQCGVTHIGIQPWYFGERAAK